MFIAVLFITKYEPTQMTFNCVKLNTYPYCVILLCYKKEHTDIQQIEWATEHYKMKKPDLKRSHVV